MSKLSDLDYFNYDNGCENCDYDSSGTIVKNK